MTTAKSPEIEDVVKAIVKKSATAVVHLSDPKGGSWAVYELSRAALSAVVGPDALHERQEYRSAEELDRVLDLLTDAINKASDS